MTKYELLYIIPGKYSEEEIIPIKASVAELLKKNNSQIIREQDLGKKKLAYSIKQNGYGYYSLINFDTEGEVLAKIENALLMMPEILRRQIVYRLEEAKTTAKTRAPKPTAETRPLPSMFETRPTAAAAELPTLGELSERKPEEKKDKPAKISLDELDKKLDEILKNDII